MGLSFFNAERQKKKAIDDSLSFNTSKEEPTSPSNRGVEVGVDKEIVKPKKKKKD